MISLSSVWSLARAEMRTIFRLVRFWVFAALATLIGLVAYFYYAVIHGLFSNLSGSIGAVSPKFLMGQFALWQTIVFVIGVVFLAFDVRARDVRDRMVEVLDTRPYSNAELVLGRLLGTLLAVLIPVTAVMALIQTVGVLAVSLRWYVGEVVVWSSVFHYLLLDALPAFAFYIALVYLVSLLTRNRLVSAIAALAVLGVTVWIGFVLPVYMVPIVGITGGYTGIASEVAPELFSGESFLWRGAVALAAVGLLGLAAAVHPRLDGGRRKLWGAGGAGLVAVAVAIAVGSVISARAAIARSAEWRQAHEARIDEPVVDLQRIAGEASLRPGRSLELDLELTIAGPREGGAVESALFSLNPGLEVGAVHDAGGRDLAFSHENGLLEVELGGSLSSGESATLSLEAAGEPNLRFAYLDSAIDIETVSGQQAQLGLLGTEAGFFDRRLVALMPSLAWLPRAGASVALDDPRRRPTDFLELDLEVTAPAGWQVAGPGKVDQPAASDERTSVRLAPAAPVPEVALVAGRFERRATEIEGVLVELLFHEQHGRNVDFFAEALPEIERRAAEMLSGARGLGLPYPYRSLSLVEVPWTLRSYGGGWRMDTVQAPPGLLLLSEGAFPTTRFEFAFRNPDRFEEREGGIARAKLEALERFFENDFSGGNVLHGFVRNLFLHQTSARGPEALALDSLCHDLANRLVTGREGYFSAHLFDASMGWVIAQTIPRVAVGQASGETVAHALIEAATDRPAVWDAALEDSLTEMDPWDDPKRSVDVLVLKTSALASTILDGAGRQRAGRMLAILVERHRGSTFDRNDLMAAANEAGIDLEALLGDFLHQTALPGFYVSAARLDRLRDGDQGLPQYQTRLFVRNGEAVPGLLRLRYSTGEDERRPAWETSEPVRVPPETSLEIGLVTSKPPTRLFVSPYLSLNRRDFPVELPEVDQEEIVNVEPLRGAQPADWRPAFDDAGARQVVVDDLDPGFRVEESDQEGGLRLGGGIQGAFRPPEEMDQGLPSLRFGAPPATWSRTELDSSWGRYRRTVAVIGAGDGSRTATFAAELPHSGPWRLELHVPPRPTGTAAALNQGWRYGSYDLELRQGGQDRAIEFDAGAAEAGWSSLGTFELDQGEVEVSLSDDTSGTVVLADALRFVPLDAPVGSSSESSSSSTTGTSGGRAPMGGGS
ncbi:MAG TPA: ABC transporter permease subunit [Thermoanaerobaculia bacterium]|nr:ABC transporter permease subunit [Thermoanaerobaculia bacterium]